MNYTALGNQIQRLRHIQNLTQAQLAEKAGISLSLLNQIERGSRAASLSAIVAIANALNATPDQLLADSINKPPFIIPMKNGYDYIEEIQRSLDGLKKWLAR